jgi:hypothetical protein
VSKEIDADPPSRRREGFVRLVSSAGTEDVAERVVGGWSAGSRHRGDFALGLALLIHQLAVGGCREAMPPRAEVTANGAEWLQKALRLLG